MKLSKALYFGDFVAIPVAYRCQYGRRFSERGIGATGLWLFAFVVGLAVWTFVEYVVHRWVYHAIPFFEKFHDAHHDEPKALIGVPSFVSSGVMLAVFFLPLYFTVGIVFSGGFSSGAMLGLRRVYAGSPRLPSLDAEDWQHAL